MPMIESEIEGASDWFTRVGPDISGQANALVPQVYGMVQRAGEIELYIAGQAWQQFLAGRICPILPNTGKLTCSFMLWRSALAEKFQNAMEMDHRLEHDGWDYNMSLQIVDGKIQIAKPRGAGWQDTGLTCGPLPVETEVEIAINYRIDFANKIGYLESIAIGGKLYTIPLAIEAEPSTDLGWKEGLYKQVQIGLAGAPGCFSVKLSEMQNIWS